jgi:acyl-lipid omega-6 desaturase (Delta-12 desaturase)
MEKMPELHGVGRTSWNPFEVIRCFRLKLWDPNKGKMVTLSEFRSDLANTVSL